jgi:phosphoesterase RecJ-like protein
MMIPSVIKNQTFKEVIENVSTIVVVPHHNPDGDALGSALGLTSTLTALGKKVTVVSPNEIPGTLTWIPGASHVLNFEKQQDLVSQVFNEVQLLIMVDFNSTRRVKEMSSLLDGFKGAKLMIDHHPEPDMNAAHLIISDISVSSTCELMCKILFDSGLYECVSVEAATCFYTGIMTDTGALSHNSSRPQTYHVVASLLEKGIPKEWVHQMIFHSNSLDRMRLLGYCLCDKMMVLPYLRAAYITLTAAELDRFHFQPGDTEGLVNYPLGIEGIDVSAFFMERDGKVKVSLRSRGNIAVNKLSEANFNGGGHHNAAGGESVDSMDVAVRKFVDALPAYLF